MTLLALLLGPSLPLNQKQPSELREFAGKDGDWWKEHFPFFSMKLCDLLSVMFAKDPSKRPNPQISIKRLAKIEFFDPSKFSFVDIQWDEWIHDSESSGEEPPAKKPKLGT